MDYSELSQDHQTKVDEFKSITGSDDDSNSQIIRLLQINDWDLNNSIVTFFESGFLQESPIETIPSTNNTHSSAIDDTSSAFSQDHLSHRYSTLSSSFEDLIPKLPFAPRISNSWQLEIGINASKREYDLRNNNFKALNTIMFLVFFIPNKVLSLLYQVVKYLFKINSQNYFPSQINHETLDLDYKQDLPVDKYNIVENDFNQIYEDTKQNYSWLLVILVNESTESDNFMKRLLSNPHFENHFSKANNTNHCIYINNVDKNPEAFEIGKTYKVKRLPYIMLISNVSNSPQTMASMSITYKSNISSSFLQPSNVDHTVNKISHNLSRIVDNYQPQLIAALTDKREMEFARLIKQQQDDAYQKSLEQDRVKKQEKKQRQELEDFKQQRDLFLFNILKQNWFDNFNQSPNTRIQIKLPSGERLVLNIDNQLKLRHLYLHIDTKLFAAKLLEDNQFNDESHLHEHLNEQEFDCKITENDYIKHFPFKFELIQPYPKKVFDDLDAPIGKQLKSGASLLVEHIIDSEDELEQ